MFEQQIKECDETIATFTRLKRKYEAINRIRAAEQRARVRKIVQANYKVDLASCVDACIQCGLIDKDLNIL